MKRCLSCDNNYESSLMNCTTCGFTPTIVDGFSAFAPKFNQRDGGFKPHYFSELVQLETTNFWFRARNQLIVWALNKYYQKFSSFLEIGCGTGFVLSGISKAFPQTKLVGSEIFTTGLDIAAARVPSASFLQMDARSIPYHEEFEVIGAFDVLEHIEEDETVLEQIILALKPNGIVLVTVPQHDWLWSANDDYACHVRRYTAPDLHQKLQAAGFRIERTTSFITTLLPAMMVSRLLNRNTDPDKFDATAEFKIASWLNNLFFRLLQAEQYLIRKGINFPIGGSRLVVARKQ